MTIAANAVTTMTYAHSKISNNPHKEAIVNPVLHCQKTDRKGINIDCRAPIGLFDSGIGGLSVYLHLAQQLPHERYIYYADTLHVPYGNRDSDDIKALYPKTMDRFFATLRILAERYLPRFYEKDLKLMACSFQFP